MSVLGSQVLGQALMDSCVAHAHADDHFHAHADDLLTPTRSQVVSNLECLDDCFLSEESRCVASLLKDVIRRSSFHQLIM